MLANILPVSFFSLLVFYVQTQDTVKFQNNKDSIRPLLFYIETAITNSPLLKMHEAQIDQKKIELQLMKYAWMREIFVTADTKLGNYGNANPVDQLNLGYGTGAFVRLPITAIVGNGDRKKLAKLEIEKSVYQQLSIEEELKKLIIKQYNEVLLKRDLIKIQIKATDVALINYKVSELEYKNGAITVDAYARTTEIYFTQLASLEKIKSEYKSAFQILNEISGNN